MDTHIYEYILKECMLYKCINRVYYIYLFT